jgi:hypothetical protein
MRLFYVPIEPYPNRYSEQWIRWFEAGFKRRQIDYKIVFGKSLNTAVSIGSVFNPVSISHYRATQLVRIHKLVAKGILRNGDVIFFDDGQFPGVEQIAQYLPQIGYYNVRLYSFMHAGTWDKHDYVHRFNLVPWLFWEEQAWFNIFEKVFVATRFHRDLITKQFPQYADKVVVTGEPFNTDEILSQVKHIPDFKHRRWDIVYPWRVDTEKGITEFMQLVQRISRTLRRPVSYTIPVVENRSKREYYEILANSKIVLSAAKQETFGIAVAEAVVLGCIPVLPNALSYADIYPYEYLYDSTADAVSKVCKFLLLNEGMWQKRHRDLLRIVSQFNHSIDRILTQMGF